MPYTIDHKQKTRRRIVASAKAVFSRDGFEKATIDGLMEAAGLTRGGFYAHFKNKQELFINAILTGVVQPGDAPWAAERRNAKNELEAMVRSYIGEKHCSDIEGSCPLVAFPGDVSRGDAAMKAAYREVANSIAKTLESRIRGNDTKSRSLALLSMIVGSVIISRGVGDAGMANDVRSACIGIADEIASGRA